MVGIYKITNKLNGKAYIGQSIDIKRRWRQHKITTSKNNQNRLYKDFEKYGLKNFQFEIIEECKREELDEREIYWIKKFDTYNNGYNLTTGGTFPGLYHSTYLQLFSEMEPYRKITSKQWKNYYQLMSVSKYNAQKVENHRYLYKKNINITAICRVCGIKSTKTFYNAIERLSEYGLVKDNNDSYLLYAPDWIEIFPQTLTTLLAHTGNTAEDIDLLRTFLILKKMNKLGKTKEDKSFTVRAIVQLLNHGTSNSCSYERVRFYLGMLSYWGLIKLKVHKEYNSNIGAYSIYHLQEANETGSAVDFTIDENAEVNAPLMSDEMMQKLKFKFPSIVE